MSWRMTQSTDKCVQLQRNMFSYIQFEWVKPLTYARRRADIHKMSHPFASFRALQHRTVDSSCVHAFETHSEPCICVTTSYYEYNWPHKLISTIYWETTHNPLVECRWPLLVCVAYVSIGRRWKLQLPELCTLQAFKIFNALFVERSLRSMQHQRWIAGSYLQCWMENEIEWTCKNAIQIGTLGDRIKWNRPFNANGMRTYTRSQYSLRHQRRFYPSIFSHTHTLSIYMDFCLIFNLKSLVKLLWVTFCCCHFS